MSARIGYLVPEFPGQTHIFFWREIEALRNMGEDVRLLSTRRPRPMICRHAFAHAGAAETHYLFPPSVRGLAAWLLHGCPGLPQARAYADAGDFSRPKARLRFLGLLASAIELVRWARREGIGHIHCHSCADSAHVVALAHRMGGPPYSLTLHGDLDVYGKDHHVKMEQAEFVSAVGTHLRDEITTRIGIPAGRIRVSCMGVETSELVQLGRDRSYTRGRLHLVTVARLHPVKGHIHALAAIERGLQAGLDLRYTIAGEGPYRDALLSRIAKSGLNDRVTLTGTLSSTEVNRLLSCADAFILPSTGKGEAWPVSVMEAMGAGLPVISTVIGATPEMITPGVDGFLVPQGDQDGLLERITLLADDVDLRRGIGEAARNTARRRFDVTATAGALRDAVQGSLVRAQSRRSTLHAA